MSSNFSLSNEIYNEHKHKYSNAVLVRARPHSIEYSQETPHSSRVRASYGLSSVSIFFPPYDMYVKMSVVMPVIKK